MYSNEYDERDYEKFSGLNEDLTEQEEIMIKQADFIYDSLNDDQEYKHRGKTLEELNKQWGIE